MAPESEHSAGLSFHRGHAVEGFAGRRVLVVGDVMLDEYLAGEARRLSPEAPVPVVQVTSRWATPGGAANAAANAAALGGAVQLGGVIGVDSAADELLRQLLAAGVRADGLIPEPTRPTTTKLRILASGQQVVRIDTESTLRLRRESVASLLVWIQKEVQDCDALLISDYDKGVVGDHAPAIIETARSAGCPVVVDAKGGSRECFSGCTVLKPNRLELKKLTGMNVDSESELDRAGEWLAGQLAGSWILVTCGAEGMSLFNACRPPRRIRPLRSQKVFDVTGAGDTVAAVLALGLASGLDVESSAKIGAIAAGLVVSRIGTCTVKPQELIDAAEG